MSLRARLTVLAVAIAAATVTAFGVIAYRVFVAQQASELRALLRDDLARVGALLAQPRLGASVVDPGATASALQFVAPDGTVLQRFGPAVTLPEGTTPQRITAGDRTFLAASAPWPATGGTLRLGHDITDALAARHRLARTLLVSGALVALGAALTGSIVARRAVAPLRRVADRARALDPVSPSDVPYRGPADEVADLAHALNDSLARIRSQAEAERAFLVEIAHELAGPLTRVSSHLEALRRDRPQDGRARSAADAARELLRTSQDLLVLARGELERPLEPAIVDLAAVAGRIAAEYEGVTVRHEGTATIVGDAERLGQALRNLVRNGVQASGDASRVAIGVRGTEDVATVEVRDAGPGMAPDLLTRVLAATRGRPLAPEDVHGAGVGLTIVKRIVEQHDGLLDATSAVGEGTRFRLRFPSLASRTDRTDTDRADVAEGRG